MRLFIGLEIPAALRAELAALDPRIRGVRWLPPEQLHMTLSFLGEIDVEHEARVRGTLGEVRVPAFFLPVRGLGLFGGEKPGVIWAGVGKGHPHLFALHQHVQDAVIHAGIEPDLKPFQPHVTLARMRGVSRGVLKPLLHRHADTDFGIWKVTEFVLFSSRLLPEGPVYTVEQRQVLAQG